MKAILCNLLVIAGLSACSTSASTQQTATPTISQSSEHAQALLAFTRSCARLTDPAWKDICAQASNTPPAQAGQFFASQFRVVKLAAQTGEESGLLTAYYEPIIRVSKTPTGKLNYPLYARPDNLPAQAVYADRKTIETSAPPELKDKVIAYGERMDAYLLGVQGSGRIQWPDGQITKLINDGMNNQPYKSIGKILIEAGALTQETVSVPTIRAWVAAHPDKADWLLHQNPRIVFFKPDDGSRGSSDGPPGAMGIKAGLTPGYSIAVDPLRIPLGTPVQISSSWPDGRPLQRLVIAQDKGAAIKGSIRADLFLGVGAEAEQLAGIMKQALTLEVLWPINVPLPASLQPASSAVAPQS
ncbi:murein transglycosylase A [Chitinilyticum aquatile]|uniref:murein transglycosylase A n=1 Tax=Chitinilyticum aquatile TaxID=362520 RepID=UPI0003FA12B2|nr:MltA domain-containing protein [Chitinilyticum aquatile]